MSFSIRLLQFNLWANDRLARWLHTVDQALLYSDTGSSFPSIDRTLQHISASQEYWQKLIAEGIIGDLDKPDKENAIDEVINDFVTSSDTLLNAISLFNDDQLLETIQASDSSQSRYEYILHVVNHGSYHRGQIVSMARSLGYTGEIPSTDYDAYLWWIENSNGSMIQ